VREESEDGSQNLKKRPRLHNQWRGVKRRHSTVQCQVTQGKRKRSYTGLCQGMQAETPLFSTISEQLGCSNKGIRWARDQFCIYGILWASLLTLNGGRPYQTSHWGSCTHASNARRLKYHLEALREDGIHSPGSHESPPCHLDLWGEICHVSCWEKCKPLI
jgi:hypothetical protein